MRMLSTTRRSRGLTMWSLEGKKAENKIITNDTEIPGREQSITLRHWLAENYLSLSYNSRVTANPISLILKTSVMTSKPSLLLR